MTALSRSTRELSQLLGAEVSRSRRERRWSQAELAQRVGVSIGTLRALEQGSPSVSLGVAFETAHLLGIDLFGGADAVDRRAAENRRVLELLPRRIRHADVDDDF